MVDRPTVLEVGARIAETYETVRLIGRGGMGEVWCARHLRLPGKQVAIKVLHTEGAALSGEALARFRREAEVATRIGHPNIVEVHDYNTLPSGTPYLVLELLQGESLASRLRFGPMSLDEVMAVVKQVGSALDASHQLGVVHRDLKPDNIFLVPVPNGTLVKVLDFGISKVVDSRSLHTADEVLIGTPQYMSPEQAVGQNKDVGPQTDVFALGSIVYEMLSGAPPFVADSVAKVVFRIAYEKHVPLTQVKPGLPERVYVAVEGALEKDRSKRFDSVATFVAAFTGQPVPRTVPPPAMAGTSGVARPGMATPDSMAWGVTAAQTPSSAPAPLSGSAAAPNAAALPAPVAAPSAAPGGTMRWAVLGVLVLAGAGVAAYLQLRPVSGPAEPVAKPQAVQAPIGGTEDRPAVESPDAGHESIAVGTAELAAVASADAGQVKTSAVVKPPRSSKIPAEEQAVLDELTAAYREQKLPFGLAQRRLIDIHSDAGRQRAYFLIALVACREHDLGGVRAFEMKLQDGAERRRLVAECKKLGMEWAP